MLDGYPVAIGDPVYVMGIGSGVVTSTNADGGFSVRAGAGELYYRDGGYIGNQKRVFWADPMILTPPKNRRLWRCFVNVASVLYSQLEKVYKLGGHGDGVDEGFNDTV